MNWTSEEINRTVKCLRAHMRNGFGVGEDEDLNHGDTIENL